MLPFGTGRSAAALKGEIATRRSMGKSMSLFKSRCLITYGILIPELIVLPCFTFRGYAIAIVCLFLDINERNIRTCAAVSQRQRFGCGTVLVLATRGSWITMAIATYHHQPSLFWLLCATNIPSVWAKLRRLTPLGNHLAQLPVDAGCAKLLASQKNLVIFAEFCRTWKLGTMWALWKCLFKTCISVLLFWI